MSDNPTRITYISPGEGGNKSRSSYFDMIKWVSGTLILGIAGITINVINGCNDRELKRVDIDARMITEINSKASGMNSEAQKNYLTEMSDIMLSDIGKVFIEKKITKLTADSTQEDTTIKAAAIVSENKANKIISSPEGVELKDQLIKQATQIVNDTQQPINTFKQHTEAIVAGSGLKPIGDSLIRIIEQVKLSTVPKVSEEYILYGKPETHWCKEGYYIDYNSSLRLGINTLTKNGITFNLKDITRSDSLTAIENGRNYSMQVGDKLNITTTAFRYLISLDNIGRAGKNPFTSAAYITIATYQK